MKKYLVEVCLLLEELREILIGIFGIADSGYDLIILYLGFCVLDGLSYLLILTIPCYLVSIKIGRIVVEKFSR
ncbi:MAG: hypothetical protein F6K24_33855 [Okeania sp. SIO2D1]|nr:hypothetical protein [Okeania sp. SIO2D1]